MGIKDGKYTAKEMAWGTGGKVESGPGESNKQIPPNIGSGGAGPTTKGVQGVITTSAAQIPPMMANPGSKPNTKDGTLD